MTKKSLYTKEALKKVNLQIGVMKGTLKKIVLYRLNSLKQS